MITAEAFLQEPECRWQENLTKSMDKVEMWKFLRHEARRMESQEEWELAYDIYRELVWRFPDRSDAWSNLARVATIMGFNDEARVATGYADRLKNQPL